MENKPEKKGMQPEQPIQCEIDAILAHIEKGVKPEDIRKDYTKYLLSGETKEIIINEGGQDLQLGENIVKEMAARGHIWAKKVIADGWKGFRGYRNSPEDKYIRFTEIDLSWFSVEELRKLDCLEPREDPILISIIKDWDNDDDPNHVNIGGMRLAVYKVPVEDWAYRIINNDDPWNSETIRCEFRGLVKRIGERMLFGKRRVKKIAKEEDIPLTDSEDKKKEEAPLSDNKAEIPLTDSKDQKKEEIPLCDSKVENKQVSSKKKKPKKHHKKQNKSLVSVSIPEATKKRKENSFVITEPSHVQ